MHERGQASRVPPRLTLAKEYGKERDGEGDNNVRTEPDDDQRPKRDLRDHVERDKQRKTS